MVDPTRKRTVHVEGNIGAGKSELLRLLSSLDDVGVVPEPVENWSYFRGINALQLLYDDPKKNGYPFQLLVMSTLAMRKSPSGKRINIFERSIQSSFSCFGKHLRNQGLLSDLEFGTLDEVRNMIEAKLVGKMDVVIYLNVTPELAMDRIMQRNRPEEKNVQLSFLESLGQLYDEWIGTLVSQNKEVFIVDANRPLMEVANECYKIIGELNQREDLKDTVMSQDWDLPEITPCSLRLARHVSPLPDIEDCCKVKTK